MRPELSTARPQYDVPAVLARRPGSVLNGVWRRRSVFNRRAHQSQSRDYAVTPWCGKPMPTLGGKLRIPGRKTMKPRFPTNLPESLYYSRTILSLFGGGGRNRTDIIGDLCFCVIGSQGGGHELVPDRSAMKTGKLHSISGRKSRRPGNYWPRVETSGKEMRWITALAIGVCGFLCDTIVRGVIIS